MLYMASSSQAVDLSDASTRKEELDPTRLDLSDASTQTEKLENTRLNVSDASAQTDELDETRFANVRYRSEGNLSGEIRTFIDVNDEYLAKEVRIASTITFLFHWREF